jgi:hypothetical protein
MLYHIRSLKYSRHRVTRRLSTREHENTRTLASKLAKQLNSCEQRKINGRRYLRNITYPQNKSVIQSDRTN